MMKAKKYDWKDSNMEMVGSSEDRSVKKQSAETETAWNEAKKCTQPNLFIWRIEKFKVVPWRRDMYGEFYEGDSYIVLNIYKDENELLYDVHFWIGKYSTQDEYGTAAYKTVELDTLLDDKPIQHREVQNYESDLFKSYFNSIIYLKGGCESGFRHVTTQEYKPRLLHVRGEKKNIVISEVGMNMKNVNSGDIFILDTGTDIIQWIGKSANMNEKFKSMQFVQGLESDRHGKAKTEVVDEGDSSGHRFYNIIEKNASDGDDEEDGKGPGNLSEQEKKLFQISDQSGSLEFKNIATGDLNKSQINEDDVYIVDNGQCLYVYVGEGASYNEKKNALAYAHKYLQETSYPQAPVSVVKKDSKGVTAKKFNALF